jgi:hypothetical protein
LAIARLGRRAAIGTRCSPHTFRHTFARGYLVNGDVFSLRQILGHATLDMVRRYVSLSEADLVARHRTASPADRLVGMRGVRRSPSTPAGWSPDRLPERKFSRSPTWPMTEPVPSSTTWATDVVRPT